MLSSILIDTSVLVDLLRRKNTRQTQIVHHLEEVGEPYSIPALCAQEVLQGAKTEGDWRKLKEFFSLSDLVVASDPLVAHVDAARIYYDCRKKGLTVRSSIDCLVASLAIEKDALLLHADLDYHRIQKVRKTLKFV